MASRVAERLKTQDPRKLGDIRKVPKPHRMIAQSTASPAKIKISPILAKKSRKIATKPLPRRVSHTKTRASLKYPAPDCSSHCPPPGRHHPPPAAAAPPAPTPTNEKCSPKTTSQ